MSTFYALKSILRKTENLNRYLNLPIRIDFKEEEVEKFNTVKNCMGLKQNTEVIRVLISEKYNEIQLIKQRRQAQLTKEAKAMEWLEKGEYKCPM